ncbi:MAG: ABC-2 family transporter protein [Firmicutes bacterium]|nr:ABC-2 family transporter protein [Bacillota bacterium]
MENVRLARALIRARLANYRISPETFWVYFLSVGLYQLMGLAFVLVTTSRLEAGAEWLATYVFGVFQGATGLAYSIGAWTVFLASRYVRRGELDMLMLLPVGLNLVMPCAHFEPGEIFTAVAGFVIALFGLHIGRRLMLVNLLLTGLGVMAGAAIVYSFFVIAASLVLYNKGLATGINLAMDLVQFGQYPMRFYPGTLRVIFTWGLPLVLIANVPARLVEAGLSGLPWYFLPGLVGCGVVALLIANAIFRQGTRRFVRHW